MEPHKQIKAVAQTYLQEQQLREQAEYIAVLENIVATIAEQSGLTPEQLIEELFKTDAQRKDPKFAGQQLRNAARLVRVAKLVGGKARAAAHSGNPDINAQVGGDVTEKLTRISAMMNALGANTRVGSSGEFAVVQNHDATPVVGSAKVDFSRGSETKRMNAAREAAVIRNSGLRKRRLDAEQQKWVTGG